MLEELEQQAKRILSKPIYDHIAGGAGKEQALEHNVQAFSEWSLVSRVLENVKEIKTDTPLLGETLKSPILIAPMSFHGLVHPDKELATAKAAEEAENLMVVSMMSNTSLEEIAASVSSPLWFQLHILTDRSATLDLIKRAEQAKYQALVLTVDIPKKAERPRDIYNKFKPPASCVAANFIDQPESSDFNPSATWEDITWLKTVTHLPIILKGIMSPSDAWLAVKHSVAGIIVSNHGGRQLDSAPATLEVLPAIAHAVQGKIAVLLDGGIRHGSDVVKAIALGADAVLVGRPILFGLATGGKAGVKFVLNYLHDSLILTMQLIGCPSTLAIKKHGQTLLYQRKGNEQALVAGLKNLENQISKLAILMERLNSALERQQLL